MAVLAYKKGQIKSKLRAARVFEVPETTLYDWLSGINARIETHVNGYKMTAIEEEVLIKRLLEADK